MRIRDSLGQVPGDEPIYQRSHRTRGKAEPFAENPGAEGFVSKVIQGQRVGLWQIHRLRKRCRVLMFGPDEGGDTTNQLIRRYTWTIKLLHQRVTFMKSRLAMAVRVLIGIMMAVVGGLKFAKPEFKVADDDTLRAFM